MMRGLTAESGEIRTIAVIVPDSPNKPSRTMLTLETQVGRASNIVADLQTGKFKVRKAQRLESYSAYKDTTASEVLKTLDEKGLTEFVYNMYEMYHCESIYNAFEDIDSLIETGKQAW